jgi:hypothetical protein
MTTKQQAIQAMWDSLDDEDVSTERLIQMVSDACSCSSDDVISVVFKEQPPTPPTQP